MKTLLRIDQPLVPGDSLFCPKCGALSMICKRNIAPGTILYPDMFEFKNYSYDVRYDDDKCTVCLTSIGAPKSGWLIERSGLSGVLYE